MKGEETQEKSTQITLKVPTSFLKEFDGIVEQLGYPRNEAIRESMRRFLEWAFQKANERHPERSMDLVQGMISSIFGGMAEKTELFEKGEYKKLQDKSSKT